MKIKILYKLFLFLVVLSIGFLPNQLAAQCWENIYEPPHPALLNDYDGRDVAYVTNGNQGIVNWINTSGLSIWELCKGKVPNYNILPLNTPNPLANSANKLYLQISEGDIVSVDSIKFSNNVTLVVCGVLDVGNIELEFGGIGGLNRAKIIVCEGGILRVNVLSAQNNVALFVDGLLEVNTIDGQTTGLCIFSPNGTGVIQTPQGTSPTIEPINNWHYGPITETGGGQFNCGNSTNPEDGDITLPIELLSFTPSIKPDRVELNWTTGSEINNDYFTLERSRDLYGWEVLGFVEGAGNSSVPLDYGFTDFRPLDGLGYYRLKQTDFDGKFKYYGPIAAHYDLGLEGLDFKVMKQYTNWVIAVPNDGFYQVEVYNLQGHRLHSERVENTLAIPAPEGAVVIRVTDGFERSASRVVM
jgi:hypothetical protein